MTGLNETKAIRARYVGDCNQPVPGSLGYVQACAGYSDPSSIEEGAYMFNPDGDENCYYIGDSDWEEVTEESAQS